MPAKNARQHIENKTVGFDDGLLTSFERHLKAERKEPTTIAHYLGATRQFVAFCQAENLPGLVNVSREHVELWLGKLHETYKPHSVRNRFIGLRIFYKWLAEEGEITRNPMDRLKQPTVDETSKDVVTQEEIQRVLTLLDKARNYRDGALVAVLYDTGMRATELADCKLEQVSLDNGLIRLIKTKNHRERIVSIGPSTVRLVDRYLRRRNGGAYLFESKQGKLTRSGVYALVRAAFAAAGVTAVIGAHDLRHTAASHMVDSVTESEMMALFGWSDPEMARHYARAAIEKAAIEAHRRASNMERLKEKKR